MQKGFAARALERSLALAARGMRAGRTAGGRALAARRDARPGLIVLDPGLIEMGGHHFEFARLLRTQFGDARNVSFYVHAAAAPLVFAALDARPVFKDSIYPRHSGAPFAQTYALMTRSLAEALASVNGAGIDAETIAMMHTTTVFALGALAAWYASLPKEHRPKLFIQFQHALEFMVEPREAWPDAVRAARDAAGTLAAAGFVRFAANSAALAAGIAAQLGQPCALMPIPVRWPDREPVVPEDGPVFGFFGGLRQEKGAACLARAVTSFAALYRDTRFIIHASPGSDLATVDTLDRIPQVELLRKTFARKSAYYAAFRRARWMLLPYDPEPYAIRTSGVFIEALGLGIPVVVTAGTWMASELAAHAAPGLVMAEYSAAALYDCLGAARTTMLAGDVAPRAANETVIAEHSPANFCQRMLRVMQA